MENELKKVKKQKKYGLVWEDHEEPNLNKNAIPLLTERTDLSLIKDEKNLNHMLIEGDNYQALRSLQFTHKEKIDVIYIDPPYNTGNKDFVYNDSFVDSEDSFRHSKWLSFMEKRLKLAHELLSDNGVIFISIDDNEQAQLKLLCDKIFNENNFITSIPKLTSAQRPSQEKFISVQHEYLLIYKKNINTIPFNRIIKRKNQEKLKKDNIGLFFENDTSPILASKTQGYSKGGDYDYLYKNILYKPIDSNGNRRRWLWSIDRMKAADELGLLIQTKNGLRVKNYINKEFQLKTNKMIDKNPNLILSSYDFMDSKYATKNGSKLIEELNIDFNFAKPLVFIKELIDLNVFKNSIILDFFAGSGTTGHAVMELNKEDGGNRQFILCTNNEVSNDKEIDYLIENQYILSKKDYKNFKETESYQQFINSEDYQLLGIARQVTRERLVRVINGYTKPNGENVDGLEGNNLHYYQTNEFANIKNKLSDYEIYELKENIIDLLKIKHQTYKTIHKESMFSLYENEQQVLGLLTSEFGLDEMIEQLKNNKKKLIVYVFVWSNDEYTEITNQLHDLLDNDIEVIQLPRKLIEFYK